MILPDGWSWGTIPADAHGDEIRFGYRRYNGRDRLEIMGWIQQATSDMVRGMDQIEIGQKEIEQESASMSQRLVDADGEPWTAARLEELAGARPAAFRHLSQTLNGPGWDEWTGKGDSQKKNLGKPLRYLRGIHRLRYALARSVSDSPTNNGSPSGESTAASSETMAVEHGS